MKVRQGIAVGGAALMFAGCALAPAATPTPEIITKTVTVPGPAQTVLVTAPPVAPVEVTPQVCLTALHESWAISRAEAKVLSDITGPKVSSATFSADVAAMVALDPKQANADAQACIAAANPGG